jgi:hypothetical protein
MSIDYRIDTLRGIVFTVCQGNITAEDLGDIAQRLRADPAFNPDYRLLLDLTEVTEISVSFEMLQRFASDQKGDPFSGRSRRAVVAPDNLTFGVSRMYEALRENRDHGEFRVFRAAPEARKWLGLEESAGTRSSSHSA